MKRRVLFYSHDTFGLGHFRRSLTLASQIVRNVDDVAVLMLTGVDSAAAFEPVKGIDFVKLPGVWKSGREHYRSRHLKVSFERVQRIRREMLRGVARAFDPHMVVVDNSPRGVGGELLSTLRYLRRRKPSTRVALTLRDVLDEPEHIIPLWNRLDVASVLRRFYDEVWIAGSRSVFDTPTMYEFPEDIVPKVRWCGYVVRAATPLDSERLRRELRLEERRRVLVSVGGGGDGDALVDTWAAVAPDFARDGIDSLVLLGPDMPIVRRREIRQRFEPLGSCAVVLDFHPEVPALLDLSTVSVSMAGYNTTCEVVASRKPALLVPRVSPRREQLLRANAMEALGLATVLHPAHLDPQRLRQAVCELLRRADNGSKPLPEGMDFAGASRIVRRVRKHLDEAVSLGKERTS